MGLFRRSKKEEEPAADLTQTVEPIHVKSAEEIQKERMVNELGYLRDEITSKTDHLNAISEKLAKVKEEYDHVVTALMSSKREINEKKSELETINVHYEQKKRSLSEFEVAAKDLASVKSEYLKYKTESEELKARLKVLQNSYEENKRSQEAANQKIVKGSSELESARKEIEEIRKEREAKKKEIDLAKKELKFIEEQMTNVGDRSTPKNVVAAASSVVASLNSKLLATQKELEILKIVLQRERAEHEETKKRLDAISKSD